MTAPQAPTAPQPLAGGDDLPPLDPHTLAQLVQLDPGGANRLMARVLKAYRDSLARLCDQLGQARQSGDLAATRLAAHTLKSSSASIGALQLAALCAQTELLVREGQNHALPAVLDRLAAEAVRVDAAVQHLMVQHS